MVIPATPRVRIAGACERLGRAEVIRRCLALLTGDRDDELLLALGGSHAEQLIGRGVPSDQAYWARVWAARGLLWAGVGDSTIELRRALSDDSWRVREMACKVAGRHRMGRLLTDVAALERDPVSRVREAAARAARRIVESAA